MNATDFNILSYLCSRHFTSQRELAEECGCSLGKVNKSLRELSEHGYITENYAVSEKGAEYAASMSPKRAVILAAGYGMRMVPINMETPKGMISVHGETLTERIIKQLHEKNIKEIYVVVGYMKEKFEYLIDEYGVELLCSRDFPYRNNIHSLKLTADRMDNCYIIPCDLWFKKNPFSSIEMYSWYMVSDEQTPDSEVRINRKNELVKVSKNESGNRMIGLSYLASDTSREVRNSLLDLCGDSRNDREFWEKALYSDKKMRCYARTVNSTDVCEINTYEQLRDLDADSEQLKTEAISVICDTFGVSNRAVHDITILKKGMTNRSFLFSCEDQKYIMRIPGEGTDKLINRREEAAVYNVIRNYGICDDVSYISPENGYKITKYISGARVCDPGCREDLEKCMKKLRWFHELELKTDHEFSIFKQTDFYESLWDGKSSVYRDYEQTKENVMSLKKFIDAQPKKYVLTHIDAVPDNFIFFDDENGAEDVRLIDWEYSGMQDPHVDIAMFCIYSLYNRKQVDELIDIYFAEDGCSEDVRTKIYCYIAACGLLWSNWCEYKAKLGVDFGEYSLRQYRYAKEYYKTAHDRITGQE